MVGAVTRYLNTFLLQPGYQGSGFPVTSLSLSSPWYWTLGSDSISLLLSPVPHSWESSADRRFQDTRYSVAQITLKKENRTNPMSSTNSARPLKKICKSYS